MLSTASLRGFGTQPTSQRFGRETPRPRHGDVADTVCVAVKTLQLRPSTKQSTFFPSRAEGVKEVSPPPV
ncbi:uncharacterized [Tachysurus ichikawai]